MPERREPLESGKGRSAAHSNWDLPSDAFGAEPPKPELAEIVLPHAAFECFFLTGEPGEWLRLWPHCRYTVGSSPACELMVDEPEISSRHALFEFRHSRFHLCDLSSATGTFIDNLPIYDHPLSHGDEIRFGPRLFRFLAGEEKALIAELLRTQGEKAFTGSLVDTPLADVLQFLHSTRKSGALSLVADEGMGTIEFHDGQILYAEMGGLSGSSAVFKMLEQRKGRFIFARSAGTRVFRRNLSESVPFLIIESARRMDESVPPQ